MNRIASLILFLPILALAQDHIVGLVEIPQLHSGLNERDNDQPLGPVTLYVEPRTDSSVAIIVEDRLQLESREHSYEQVSAVVFALSRNTRGVSWYQVRFSSEGESGYGWLQPGDAGQFRSLFTLINSAGLTYLTESWDGRLYDAPRLDAPTTLFPDREEYQDIRVVDAHNRGGLGGESWYLVVLVRGSCSGEPIEIIDYGWVPEYSASGGNTVWYYSRGC